MEIKLDLLDYIPFNVEDVRMSLYRKSGYLHPRVEDFPLDKLYAYEYELFDQPAEGRDLQLGLLLVLRFDQLRYKDEYDNNIQYRKFIDPYIETFIETQMQSFIDFCNKTLALSTARLCPLAELKEYFDVLVEKWKDFMNMRHSLYNVAYGILQERVNELVNRWFQEHTDEYATYPLMHSYRNNFSQSVQPFGWWAFVPPAKQMTYAELLYYIQEIVSAYGEDIVAEAVNEIQQFIDSLT